MILFGSLNFFYEMAIPQFLLMRRQKFRPYFFVRLFIVIALSAALYFVPNYYIGLFGISYLLVFALLLIVGMFFFRVHFFDVLFYTVAAFAVQHMVRDILFIVYDVIGGFVEMRRPLALVLYFGVYALFFLFFYLFFPVSSEAGGGARGAPSFLFAAVRICARADGFAQARFFVQDGSRALRKCIQRTKVHKKVRFPC